MAKPAGTVCEVRTTGSNANGGGFCPTQLNAGTDYTQQNAAQLSLTDVVTDGSTTVTSATGGFTTAMIGNLINIAGTTYMITDRSSSNSITTDAGPGAASGQTAKVGGAWADPGYACGQIVGGNQVWVKAGTYVVTTVTPNVAGGTMSPPAGTLASPTHFEGYNTIRGDKGTKPYIDASLIGTNPLFNLSNTYTEIDNFQLASAYMCAELNGDFSKAYRVNAVGGNYCFYCGATNGCSLFKCDGVSTGSQAAFRLDSHCVVTECTAHDCTTVAGFSIANGLGTVLVRCKSYGNHLQGFVVAKAASLIQCTAYNNAGTGFLFTSSTQLHAECINCLSVANGLYGFQASNANAALHLINCATYGNFSGATYNFGATEGMVTLTADPFADHTTLALNDTPGGGALLRGAGYGSNLSIGAVQQGEALDSPGVTTLLTRVTEAVATAAALAALVASLPPALPVATVQASPAPTDIRIAVTGLSDATDNAYKDSYAYFVFGDQSGSTASPVTGSSYDAGVTTLTFTGLLTVPDAGDQLLLIGSRKIG